MIKQIQRKHTPIESVEPEEWVTRERQPRLLNLIHFQKSHLEEVEDSDHAADTVPAAIVKGEESIDQVEDLGAMEKDIVTTEVVDIQDEIEGQEDIKLVIGSFWASLQGAKPKVPAQFRPLFGFYRA